MLDERWIRALHVETMREEELHAEREHHVLFFDATDGKQLWDTLVPPGPWTLTDLRGGYAAPTPCADADRVYVLFGSAVLAALDRDGKIIWRKPLEKYNFDVAIGTSPILVGDALVLQSDLLKKQASLIGFVVNHQDAIPGHGHPTLPPRQSLDIVATLRRCLAGSRSRPHSWSGSATRPT